MTINLQNGFAGQMRRPTRATAGLFIGTAVLVSLWAYAAASYWLEPQPVAVACAQADCTR